MSRFRKTFAALATQRGARRHLLAALRALIANDYNRQQAAAALVVHRDTRNYRLNRIGTVTGYDPNRPDHAQLFAAALTASDIDAME
ncbi:helix-turn-helix domain-containing protein [Nocardia sp. NPDC051052]|uniref:helix-turn-helix domain-containing protein n=1 Tax=Nocardia sp. NPDC051052 TaxID=3364322 RepID=UPI00379F13B0